METITTKSYSAALQKMAEKYAAINYDGDNYYIGGGLADSGKFESNRHFAAKRDPGKLTVGQFVQKVKRLTKLDTDLINYLIYSNFNLEWHHAGKLPKRYGGGMKKTYFINSDQIIDFCNNIDEYLKKREEKNIEIEQKKNTIIYGYYWVWDYDYGGRYGKKRWFKVLKFYSGSELDKPKNFSPLSKERYDQLKEKEGEEYYGYDEPRFS